MANVRRSDWETLKPHVYGWGTDDVEYKVRLQRDVPKINGKRKRKLVWTCPYYKKWRDMIQRCFCLKSLEKQPTYKGCTIYEGWRYLSNFIEWVDEQPNKDWIKG